MRTSIFIAIALFLTTQVFAQRHDGRGKQKHREKIEAEKVAFLTTELDLSVEEAQKFWPLYNEYTNKKWEMRHAMRKNMKASKNLESMNKAQMKKQMDVMMQLRVDDAKLDQEYHEKFDKILPTEKLMMFYIAEFNFNKHMLRKYHECKREGEAPPAPEED